MRAAIYHGRGDLRVEPVEVPDPGPGEALLRVSHCGVCGTDLHLVLDGWGRPGSIGGHEYSGEIVALGDGASDWQIGDPVVGGPEPSCGSCRPCEAGRPSLCLARAAPGVSPFQGAFAEYVRVSVSQLLRVPPQLSLRDAALAEPLAVALHGITLARVGAGDRVLVTGAGPIGLLALAALRASGVEDVSVSEPHPLRRELAQQLGASRVVEPEALDPPRMPFEVPDSAVDAVLECSGAPAAVESGLAQLRRAGTLVLLGTGAGRPRLDSHRLLLNELVVTGAFNYDDRGFEQALALLGAGRLPTQQLLHQQDVPLDGLLDAMKALAAGRIGGKVLVAPA